MKTVRILVLGSILGMVLFYLICSAYLLVADYEILKNTNFDLVEYIINFPVSTLRFMLFAFPVWLLLPICIFIMTGITALFDRLIHRKS